jgi:hypothetical protein
VNKQSNHTKVNNIAKPSKENRPTTPVNDRRNSKNVVNNKDSKTNAIEVSISKTPVKPADKRPSFKDNNLTKSVNVNSAYGTNATTTTSTKDNKTNNTNNTALNKTVTKPTETKKDEKQINGKETKTTTPTTTITTTSKPATTSKTPSTTHTTTTNTKTTTTVNQTSTKTPIKNNLDKNNADKNGKRGSQIGKNNAPIELTVEIPQIKLEVSEVKSDSFEETKTTTEIKTEKKQDNLNHEEISSEVKQGKEEEGEGENKESTVEKKTEPEREPEKELVIEPEKKEPESIIENKANSNVNENAVESPFNITSNKEVDEGPHEEQEIKIDEIQCSVERKSLYRRSSIIPENKVQAIISNKTRALYLVGSNNLLVNDLRFRILTLNKEIHLNAKADALPNILKDNESTLQAKIKMYEEILDKYNNIPVNCILM